ncbi:MAG: DUF3073 domain-containing protein [Actinomycetaceae bacterium]|nr:DUF3073 domain-containing protein [Actinomycetaceae bacterium]
MGRGRQKAKQRKVARNLKYFTPDTDYQALERELRGSQHPEPEMDAYAEYAAKYNEDWDDEWDADDEYGRDAESEKDER